MLLLELTQHSLESIKGIHVNVLSTIWFIFCLGTLTSGTGYCVMWWGGGGERECVHYKCKDSDSLWFNLHLFPIAVTALSNSAILSLICATCDPSSSSRLLSSDPELTTDEIYTNRDYQ